MVVIMSPRSTGQHVNHVVQLLGDMGANAWVINGRESKVVEALEVNGEVDVARLEAAPMVDRVLTSPDPLLASGRQPEDRTKEVPLGSVASIGSKKLGVIAGPCAVESKNQILDVAAAVKEAGAVALRGGAFKPRTSPYTFQGHGEAGLELLALAREETGLAIVTEVMRCEHVELVARYADVLQVGSRNMSHFHLLSEVGRQNKPVLLKRGWSATLDEFLLAAEYVMVEGNHKVILCERGIRTHEKYVRNTLALAVVPEIKRLSTLPIIVDPSHGTGQRHLVTPMSKAAIACGADGLIVEVHPTPRKAWSDGSQSLAPDQFQQLMAELEPIAMACGRGV
ncbi:MAG: 3-deoxy-7-phosphoheptulonate synthase [Phycisphaerales bacterium]|nr:MAG: 3-deoxy-7-phosphoheptulonate synthase [Phycisphaerales bacterium]